MKRCASCYREMPGARGNAKYCTRKCSYKHERMPWQNSISSYRERRKKFNLPILRIEKVTLQDLIDRDGGICQICDKPLSGEIHMDHIIPIIDPRCEHTRENLRATHAKCNEDRGNQRDVFSL